MTASVGIDLSLTATGIAYVDGSSKPVVTTVPSFGHRGDALHRRLQRLRQIVRQVRQSALSADLIVVEGPSIMSKGGSNWDRAGLWWLAVTAISTVNSRIAVAPPTVVKKWAAGRGNADKAAVAAGLTRLWPDVEPGNDNEFDALALATMGAQWLGIEVPSRAHHAACLEKVEWPASMDLTPADLAAIDEDTRHKHSADAATWTEENR